MFYFYSAVCTSYVLLYDDNNNKDNCLLMPLHMYWPYWVNAIRCETLWLCAWIYKRC